VQKLAALSLTMRTGWPFWRGYLTCGAPAGIGVG